MNAVEKQRLDELIDATRELLVSATPIAESCSRECHEYVVPANRYLKAIHRFNTLADLLEGKLAVIENLFVEEEPENDC